MSDSQEDKCLSSKFQKHWERDKCIFVLLKLPENHFTPLSHNIKTTNSESISDVNHLDTAKFCWKKVWVQHISDTVRTGALP